MRKSILRLLFMLIATNALAQNTINVKVQDAQNNSALPGATVSVKGTTNGAATDINGNASIQANGTDTLQIQMLGYTTQTVAVNNRAGITVFLQSSSIQLVDYVVVGTRRPGRIKTETPVPVDVINIGEASLPTGRMDLTSLLNYAAPSLNYNKQSGSDGADSPFLYTLRSEGFTISI